MSESDTITRATPEGVQSLTTLFEALKLELDGMAGDDPDLAALFDPDLILLAKAAYAAGVGAALDDLIAKAEEAERDGDSRLALHGLTDEPLAMKLMPIQRWMDERNAILERMSDGKYGKRPSLLGTAQKKVLGAIDLVLESFGEALGIGGMVKEYKKVFEQAL